MPGGCMTWRRGPGGAMPLCGKWRMRSTPAASGPGQDNTPARPGSSSVPRCPRARLLALASLVPECSSVRGAVRSVASLSITTPPKQQARPMCQGRPVKALGVLRPAEDKASAGRLKPWQALVRLRPGGSRPSDLSARLGLAHPPQARGSQSRPCPPLATRRPGLYSRPPHKAVVSPRPGRKTARGSPPRPCPPLARPSQQAAPAGRISRQGTLSRMLCPLAPEVVRPTAGTLLFSGPRVYENRKKTVLLFCTEEDL